MTAPTIKPKRIFGIAGGSGSGKSTVARVVFEHFGPEDVQILDQDSYYRDNSHLSMDQRRLINYDHPEAFDEDLFVEHILSLKEGRSINCPVYDYAQHTRSEKIKVIDPCPILIVEGLLVLAIPRVRELLDVKIFIDTPSDIRFIRRLCRDTKERGRSTDSVIAQYQKTVRPMHLAFVEPSKHYAEVIFPEGFNDNAQEMLNAKIRQHIKAQTLITSAQKL
ncbi:MAG: uridine kinase [Planctomycetota bacterium]|nr:uridine kinase [Planctomycetota bacterium]